MIDNISENMMGLDRGKTPLILKPTFVMNNQNYPDDKRQGQGNPQEPKPETQPKEQK